MSVRQRAYDLSYGLKDCFFTVSENQVLTMLESLSNGKVKIDASDINLLRDHCIDGLTEFLTKQVQEFIKDKIEAQKEVKEMMREAEQKKPLWVNNKICPVCGSPVDPTVKAVETGYSYCSQACAEKHVKENAPPEATKPHV